MTSVSGSGALDLVLLWHMHQPDYRDHSSGEFVMPWVYLHAIKDYADMAWHLEQHPGLRAVVNFVPVLLDQIEDYCGQFERHELRDPLLRLLAREETEALAPQERALALRQCFHANHQRLIEPFASYKRLHETYISLEPHGADALAYLSDRFFFDLVTWYHLSWTGETVRRESEPVARLMAKGFGFSRDDRLDLYAEVVRQVRQVIPRFQRLAERGQIELSTTPHNHPLAPLLLDFRSAQDAEPSASLPAAGRYSGGRARVMEQLDSSLASHARRFQLAARGVWPAEGALSAEFLSLLHARGLAWTASGEAVLANSLRLSGTPGTSRSDYLYRPYRLAASPEGPTLFFRDDRLSDLIGFEYSKWHGRDAAANFVGELEAIAAAAKAGARPVVSVILDGENAWEYYPYNGYYFLADLYESLERHGGIRTTTFDACLEARARDPAAGYGQLARLSAGSWVYGSLSTWIGSPDKNRAWDFLCEAKLNFDRVIASGRLDGEQRAAAYRQLADCEASDWFWWPGDYNPGEAVAAFEALFRGKLAHLYRLLGLPAPAQLLVSFTRGSGTPEHGGMMRRSS